jgi:hypothetical protein
MYEYGTAKTAAINNYDKTGGIAMKAFKRFVGIFKKFLGEEQRTDLQYDYYREQEKAGRDAGRYYCPDRTFVK